jgi:hypothetical protein
MDLILKRPALSIAIGVSFFTTLGLLALFVVANDFATDFSVYWRAANEPLSSVYAPRTELPFPYSPTMLLWVAPLSLIPMWLAFGMFVAMSIAAFVFVCRPYLTRIEITLALFSAPLFYALLTGQVTVILAALLLWACGTKRRAWAGAAFAVIASIKPQLVIMAPLLLLIMQDWEAIVAAALTFAMILLASITVFGVETWGAWIMSLDNFHAILLNNNVLVVAANPAGVAEHWGLSPLPFLIVGAAVGAWLAIRCRDLNPLQQSAGIAAGSLMAAPYALTYDLTAVVPFLVWSVFRGSIPAAVAIGGALNPLPLILTAYELAMKKSERRVAN